MSDPRENSLGQGAFYRPADYIGLLPRIGILVVDIVTLAGLYIATGVIAFNATEISDDQFVCAFLALVWIYMAVLKPSPVRTAGYWLFGAKIVNLKGERPSILRMTFRFLLCLFGPFSFLFDLFWVSADDQRQTLRDRFAGTCVVKHSAEPIGAAEIKFVFFSAMGLSLMYQQVTAPKVAEEAAT